ncbi:MAG: DUF2281 domain-containing protein [Rhizobacter sp.]|nr:DUF2281 domain-containing protein [Chlorobiales bacterium]
MSVIEEKFQRLTPERQRELLDFAEFLEYKEQSGELQIAEDTPGFNFSWRGALAHLKDQYTSVELQKKAMEWRDNDASR